MHNFCNLTLNVVVLQTVVYVHEYVYRDFVKDNDCTKVGVTDWCIRFFNPNTNVQRDICISLRQESNA